MFRGCRGAAGELQRCRWNCRCSDAGMQWRCSGGAVAVQWCRGAVVQWCSGAEVQWCWRCRGAEVLCRGAGAVQRCRCCADVQMSRCADCRCAEVQRCRSAEVLKC
jgi:hypothetical protein